MWSLGRAINAEALPRRRVVFEFSFPEWESKPRDLWIITRPGEPVDVCFRDPGFEVDLFVVADLRALVAVYFGRARLEEEIGAEHIRLMGSRALARSIGNWLILSS